jgi:hypothetical protein
MKILSHRGYWNEAILKNTIGAFERSFSLGFGTETDLRDYNGELVISHDPPIKAPLQADIFFKTLSSINIALPIAINIKSDGLQKMLKEGLDTYGIHNYFLFDMSTPDAIISVKSGLRIFTRQSDVEMEPILYQDAVGVWIDAFYDDGWLTPNLIEKHIDKGKHVCLVSPELHGRPPLPFWERIANSSIHSNPLLMLCTDFPEKAHSYFNHES